MVPGEHTGGGVCMYIRDLIDFELLAPSLNVMTDNLEMLSIKIKSEYIRTMNILAVYKPPASNSKSCLEYIADCMSTLDRDRADTYVLGDFKIDYNFLKHIYKKSMNTVGISSTKHFNQITL